MRFALGALLWLALAGTASAQESAPPAVPVGTVAAEHKPVTRNIEFVGRVEAPERVEIRGRVKGFLEAVLFKEADVVREGAPLYRIEQGLFQADMQQANLRAAQINLGYTVNRAPITGRIGHSNVTKGINAQIRFPDGATYDQAAHINFIDNYPQSQERGRPAADPGAERASGRIGSGHSRAGRNGLCCATRRFGAGSRGGLSAGEDVT